ncbi:MAG: NAD-dependent epimerase/dehydratase family protein, partial [Fimbriiglobus sp.]
SKKFVSNREPLRDFDESVRSVRASLLDIKFGTYVMLSSCDVYPDCSSPETTREDAPIDPATQSRYGFHKRLAELCVQHAAERHLIFRMGGFVGPGMSKNAIHDILTGGPLWLHPASDLQFLSTDALPELVLKIVDAGVRNEVFNVTGAGTVRLADVIAMTGREVPVNPGAPTVRYDIGLEKIGRHVVLPPTRETVAAYVADRSTGTIVEASAGSK